MGTVPIGTGEFAHDPLARLVDVLAGREIHHRVGTPARAPHHLLDFLGDARRHRGVADIGVHLHEEVAADDHRLGLRVVDIVRDDGAPGRHFVAHELRRDLLRQPGAEVLTGMLAEVRLGVRPGQVLANGDVLHLRCDDALPGVVHLAHVGAGLGAPRQGNIPEAQAIEPLVAVPLPGIAGGERVEVLGVTPSFDPRLSQPWHPAPNVDLDIGIRIGARGVVHAYRRVRLQAGLPAVAEHRRWRQGDFPHLDVHTGLGPGNTDLVRTRQRSAHLRVKLRRGGKIVGNVSHRSPLGAVAPRGIHRWFNACVGGIVPYAGTSRIRFCGSA